MPRATPLLEVHRALGARLTDFAGWEMPLQYAGIVEEHNAVRSGAGVFDVSHLGKLRLVGSEAVACLERALTAALASLAPGRARYSLALAEDGGCIDDVFVYRLEEDQWLVVPNAANVDDVADALRDAGGSPADEWDRWAILAVQGPASLEAFERAWPGSGVSELKLHRWREMETAGSEGFVARTGYTGEPGVELYVPARDAVGAFQRLLDCGVAPVGLGARDTLRLEMGYALYGHELTRSVNPLEAGLEWTLAWDKPFVGRAALAEVRRAGPARTTFGIRCTQRGVPRAGYGVLDAGEEVGVVTSGNFSPTLRTGIALALGPTESVPAEGAEVEISARNRNIAGIIVRPPFVPRGRASNASESNMSTNRSDS